MSDIANREPHAAMRAAIRRELRGLGATIDASVERLPNQQATEVVRLLRETDRSIQTVISTLRAAMVSAPSPDSDRGRYFPVTASPIGRSISTVERQAADERWTAAVARGQSFRARALEQVGPLLTPKEVSDLLGISVTTVNNWRHRDRLLGVRFDDHQYLYPAWQFVTSPSEGQSGILNQLDEVLVSLGAVHPWEKAKFLLARQPLFGGRTPLEIIHGGSRVEIERLKELASRQGEIGT